MIYEITTTIPTLVITSLKLSKDDDGSIVDPMFLKRILGSLMYLSGTRLDIMYGVSMISIFMESPKESHWKESKRILRYVSGTKDLGTMYSTSKNFKLIGYHDSNNGGNIDDRKSTYGYTFHFGIGVVSWASNKQPILTLFSVEAEYVAATSVTRQAV